MSRHSTAYLAALGALLVAGCNNSNGNSDVPFSGNFRVINAIPDSQPVDATVQSVDTDFNNIAFGAASGFRTIPEGSYNVQMSTAPVSGGPSVQITANNVSIDHNNQTSLYAYGTLAGNTGGGLAVERNSGNSVAAGQTEIEFVDVVSTPAATGTVYVVTPGAGITNPIYSVTLQSPVSNPSPASPPFSQVAYVTSSAYEIIITDGTGTTIFDSGTHGITFGSGTSVQFAAMDATAAQLASNGSAVTVLETDNGSGDTTTLLNGAN